ncbi:ABC1 kinase family protein [Phaeovulum sp.]|uniref:ABC1 kinase family protein n=1 Tax=Phaeovulum sp. TaxID=2934796 RepID=UPI0039E320C2
MSRLTRLGSMTAGVAGNMAINSLTQLGRGQRPKMRDLLLTPGNIGRITEQLARMRGAAMKIGQLISMDGGEVLPPELAGIMARLRADAHIMPAAQLKKMLDTNWPGGWLRAFERFDVHPVAAASIGQVHRARLKDGQELAIKVQYPGVAQSIDSDVANVGALIRMSGLLPAGFDLAPYLSEGRRQLHEETDYLREGQHLQQFRTLLAADHRFELPQLVETWTTPAILAMTFAQGHPIEDLRTAPQDQRDTVACRLIDLLLRELFCFGKMQTDPNFANYLYNPASQRIVLLDFGATRRIDPQVSDLYRRLLRAGLSQDAKTLRAVAHDLGFVGAATRAEHGDRIVRMMQMIFDEISGRPLFDFAATDLNRRMQAEGTALAKDGFVPPPLPIDVLYLQRKIGGMFLLARRLGARLPLRDMLLSGLCNGPEG